MILVITEYIQKHELKSVGKYFSLQDIKRSVKKIATSGIEMGNPGYEDCKIAKVRIGSKPVGRMIVYVQVKKEYYFPVVLCLKKDKLFGENLSLQNKRAEHKIILNLEKIFTDVQAGRYKKFSLD